MDCSEIKRLAENWFRPRLFERSDVFRNAVESKLGDAAERWWSAGPDLFDAVEILAGEEIQRRGNIILNGFAHALTATATGIGLELQNEIRREIEILIAAESEEVRHSIQYVVDACGPKWPKDAVALRASALAAAAAGFDLFCAGRQSASVQTVPSGGAAEKKLPLAFDDGGNARLKRAGFFSYVRFNDEHDDKRLTRFCEWLAREVSVQTGEPFDLWQDLISIKWGEQWKQRIKEGIEAATLLIPVITPSWFNSSACREEFEAFREVEKQRGRMDLILPVIYIATPQLKNADDPIAAEISSRQCLDISDLRNKKWMNANMGQRIADMALAIRDTLSRQPRVAAPTASQAGCVVECEHVLQTWGYTPFWPANKKDIHNEHLLRVSLKNNDSKAANFLEGSVEMPKILGWNDNPLLEGKTADTLSRRAIPITNEELLQADPLGFRKRERKPLLPSRKMMVHEERLALLENFVSSDDCLITWELGADSNAPTQGKILFRDIPVVDERPQNEP